MPCKRDALYPGETPAIGYYFNHGRFACPVSIAHVLDQDCLQGECQLWQLTGGMRLRHPEERLRP